MERTIAFGGMIGFLFAFDCIILDEAHHSAANSYKKILDYFTPKFWLGMTATPNKRDDHIEGRNIYEIFNHQIAYEIRLQQAMKERGRSIENS